MAIVTTNRRGHEAVEALARTDPDYTAIAGGFSFEGSYTINGSYYYFVFGTITGDSLTLDADGDLTGGTIQQMSLELYRSGYEGSEPERLLASIEMDNLALKAARMQAVQDDVTSMPHVKESHMIQIVFERADRITGSDDRDTIFGYGGNDTILGGKNNDIVYGGFGHDELVLGAGWDRAYGGPGTDLLLGGSGEDQLFGGDGNDTVFGHNHEDTLWGGEGDDRLLGGDGDDEILGGAGSDILYGGDGNDQLYSDDRYSFGISNGEIEAGRGDGDPAWNSRLFGESGGDVLASGNGDDSLYGGSGSDTLNASGGDDIVDGGSNHDSIFGGDGNDLIYGGTGWDLISGGAGDDTIFGGVGEDQIAGGSGADTFVFDSRPRGDEYGDQLSDFVRGEDVIALDAAAFNITGTGDLPSGRLAFGTEATGTGQRLIYDDTTGELWFDVDGSGGREQSRFAFVTPGTGLTVDDFILI